MKQSKIDSLMETLCNTLIGLLVSTVANLFVIPLVLGVTMTHSQNIALAVIFTVISIGRTYALRRLFNGRPIWATLKDWWLRHTRPTPYCPTCKGPCCYYIPS